MPEGDTIHKTAGRLRQALLDQPVRRIQFRRWSGQTPAAGERVVGVEAEGKHLLVYFAGGLTLETHMKMTGSWHLYRPGERWRKPMDFMRVVIGVDAWDAVCFSAPDVRVVPTARAGRDDLGPDLCREDVDIGVAVELARALGSGSSAIADVLLDQRLASGIGNVYKSEVLWALRVSPFLELDEVDDALLEGLYRRASRLLRANLHTNRRTTVSGGLAVYERAGRPCRRCDTMIRRVAQGPHARSTYWCPRCQPDEPPDAPTPN